MYAHIHINTYFDAFYQKHIIVVAAMCIFFIYSIRHARFGIRAQATPHAAPPDLSPSDPWRRLTYGAFAAVGPALQVLCLSDCAGVDDAVLGTISRRYALTTLSFLI